jgi:hypothetical protein
MIRSKSFDTSIRPNYSTSFRKWNIQHRKNSLILNSFCTISSTVRTIIRKYWVEHEEDGLPAISETSRCSCPLVSESDRQHTAKQPFQSRKFRLLFQEMRLCSLLDCQKQSLDSEIERWPSDMNPPGTQRRNVSVECWNSLIHLQRVDGRLRMGEPQVGPACRYFNKGRDFPFNFVVERCFTRNTIQRNTLIGHPEAASQMIGNTSPYYQRSATLLMELVLICELCWQIFQWFVNFTE